MNTVIWTEHQNQFHDSWDDIVMEQDIFKT